VWRRCLSCGYVLELFVMRLRAFVYGIKKMFTEMLDRLMAFFGDPVELSKDDAEKRERLVQTYLVIFGLLLSYNGYPDLQAELMMHFILFLIASLFYYSLLMRSSSREGLLDILAFLMGFIFSHALVLCYFSFAVHTIFWCGCLTFLGDYSIFCGQCLMFIVIGYFVSLPLLM
jgi:hypothetical protein